MSNFINKKHSHGYLEASVDSIIIDNNLIFAYSHQGKKYLWDSVNYIVSNQFNLPRKKFRKKAANLRVLDEHILTLLEYFENIGYPFVRIKFDTLIYYNNLVSTSISIEPHNYIIYDSLFFEDGVRISTKFLQNYLGFKRGAEYSEKQIQQIDSKLTALKFISSIQPSQIEFHKSSADLYLYIKNKKNNQISGLLGFTNKNNKFELTGQIDFSFINTLKNADLFAVKWQKTKSKTQNLNVDTEIPYIFSTKLGFKNHFFLEKIDSSYVEVADKFSLNYYLSGFNSISVFADFKRSIVFDTTSNYLDFNNVLYGIASNFQRLDNFYNPSKGYFANFSIGQGQKKLSDSTSMQIIANIDLGLFLQIFKHLIIHNRLFIYYHYNTYLAENELFRFGGANLMRGFDERSLGAGKLLMTTAEVRYLFDKQSNVFLFADYAIYQHTSISKNFINHPLGIGAGINFITKNNIFSISYALSKDDKTNFILKNAKIHLGVKTVF